MGEVIELEPPTEGTCPNEDHFSDDPSEFVEHGHVLCAYCGLCEKYCHSDGCPYVPDLPDA
jgi:ferredoxin